MGPKKTKFSNEIWVPSGRNSAQGQDAAPLGVAVQYSAAQEVADGSASVGGDRPTSDALEGGAGHDAGGIRAAWVSAQGPRPAMRLFCTALRVECVVYF